MEAWGPFGRGWSLERFSAQITEPYYTPLIAYPKAWSPGTDGPVSGQAIYVDARDEAGLQKYTGQLKGAIVLLGSERELKAHFEPLGARLSEKELLDLANSPEPGLRATGRPAPRAEILKALAFAAQRSKFVTDEGAALIVESSPRGDGGTVFVQGATVPGVVPFPAPPNAKRAWQTDAPKIVPQVVAASEHFNRIVRMLQQGQKVSMMIDLAVRFHDQDLMGYNTVAEIPGTDLKEEVVMLGGHMDSWHGGTGATDNAAGVAVTMEAMRILRALKLQPRRTIRIALWSGEEQGLLGSRAYVAKHFGRN
ncbi:MAG: M20/M25/M40 family metallo-hydrolase [Pyrinomonadaceae bacterium]